MLMLTNANMKSLASAESEETQALPTPTKETGRGDP